MLRSDWPRRCAILAAACLGCALAACSAPAQPDAAAPQPAGWKAVLIAGDDQEPAFDNAVDAMADKLAGFGVPRTSMIVLKASASGRAAATKANIGAAFAALDPAPGEGCFVYITSHGAPGRGLVMKRARAFLSPAALGQLPGEACAAHPTVVIASGCYSGSFATEPPMPAANRTILTAARADRPSFGCNANLRYTVFDRCIIESLRRGMGWRAVMDGTRACVSGSEFDMRVTAPSEPQIAIGADEARLLAFAR